MDWLRADARASHGVPIAAHVTTTITGAGATSYGANVFPTDSAATRASKKALADKKAEGAFYRSDRDYADRRAAQRKRDNEYMENERLKRELMEKMLLDRSVAQQEQNQALNQQAFQQPYFKTDMLGMQPPKSWNV